jgi:hypothetical protein
MCALLSVAAHADTETYSTEEQEAQPTGYSVRLYAQRVIGSNPDGDFFHLF